ELVDDDRGLGKRRVLHQTVEERGFPGAQEAGQDRERDRRKWAAAHCFIFGRARGIGITPAIGCTWADKTGAKVAVQGTGGVAANAWALSCDGVICPGVAAAAAGGEAGAEARAGPRAGFAGGTAAISVGFLAGP